MIYVVPAVLIALVAHEWAHAYMAWRLGDPTAKWMGRLTLNPLKHLDPIGTLMMVVFRFGWAKPVPINPRYFKKPRRDDFLVSIAGISMNFILFFASIMLYFSLYVFAGMREGTYVMAFLHIFAVVNAGLMIFNLLPVPPLDGFHVMNTLVLRQRSLYLDRQQMMMGSLVLVLAIASGVTSMLLGKGIEALRAWAEFVFNGIVRVIAWIV
ncbi:MAG: site-2 protease family protein [Kiritimatiellaeota bacterium]|nr:site-2 protease family protein [Kiritimatiellota bacterium]